MDKEGITLRKVFYAIFNKLKIEKEKIACLRIFLYTNHFALIQICLGRIIIYLLAFPFNMNWHVSLIISQQIFRVLFFEIVKFCHCFPTWQHYV